MTVVVPPGHFTAESVYDALNAGRIMELTVIVGGPDEAAPAATGLTSTPGTDKHTAMMVLWSKFFIPTEILGVL